MTAECATGVAELLALGYRLIQARVDWDCDRDEVCSRFHEVLARNLGRIDWERNPRGYVRQIVKTCIYRHRRSSFRRKRLERDYVADDPPSIGSRKKKAVLLVKKNAVKIKRRSLLAGHCVSDKTLL